MGRYQKAAALAVLAAFTFIIYSNTLHGPFVFDDGLYIVTNPQIQDPSLLWPPSSRYLAYLSFALNYALGGLDTFGYHLFNVAVHIANSILVFALALLFFRTSALKGRRLEEYAFPTAIIASFLFAAHPVQTQAVSYITQRFASLAALFYLLSLASYLKWRASEGGGHFFYAIALLSAIAAQFTKEIGFTLPVVILLAEFAFFRGAGRPGKRFVAIAPFLLTMAIVPALLFGPELSADPGVSENIRAHQLRDLTTISSHDYMATQLRVMVTYLRLLVLPVGQNIDYGYPFFTSFLAPEVLVSSILVAMVFGFGVFLFISGLKGRGFHSLLAGYGVLFFFIAISVESSVIPIKDAIYEHRLYLPNAGAAIFFAAMLMGLFDVLKKKFALKAPALVWAIAVTILLAAPLAAAAWSRNNLWNDETLLWKDAVAKSPANARARNNLGTALYLKGVKAEGMAEFKRAVSLDASFADARYNLGNAYKDLGQMDEATAEFESAVRLDPLKLSARNNLGLAYYSAGSYGKAIGQFEALLVLAPRHYRARNSLGLAYLKMGRPEEAASEFRAALSINPGFEDALSNLRYIELERGGK